MSRGAPRSLAASAYESIKSEIFDFVLLPGDRFSENEIAERIGVSRTPVREALYRLEREGFIVVSSRNGWSVKPFDFRLFENLYDVRVILELAAVRKLCESETPPELTALKEIWLVTADKRERDPQAMCALDESFHHALVAAAGNDELARIHGDVTERIRIIRRLDFTQPARVDATYEEHALILRDILRRRIVEVTMLLRTHVETSKAVVRQITLHKLHAARNPAAA